jgi:putative two-component system response regulator
MMAQSESAREPIDGGRGTVIVVDDLAENLEFARSTLQPSGYAVYTTDDVEHALVMAGDKKPDLLLCDLHMRPHSGLDLLDRARAEPALRYMPIVIISSTATGSYEEAECLKRGAASFIRRPIEPQALLTEIAKTMDEAKQR